VQDAREYFNEFGGIYVYDAGFRLPYYGPDHDWLDIERDHSHRLSASKLLPEELQIPKGLNFLPTTSRFFGVVNIDTNHERRAAEQRVQARENQGIRQEAEEPYLRIQVTRDRLADNEANRKLWEILRWAVDFYAMQEARRRLKEVEARRPSEPAEVKFHRVGEVLDHFRDSISTPAFSKLKNSVREAVEASETQAEVVAHRLALLAPLATAGMSALAYEHEAAKQFHSLEAVAEDLERLEVDRVETRSSLDQIAGSLREWVERAKATRELFQHLLEEESREAHGRFKLRALLESVRDQVAILTRGIEIDLSSVDEDFRLPPGSYIEWTALFQNVFFNAFNALLDSGEKKVVVTVDEGGSRQLVRVQDTGSGVDLEDAEELFRPFVRRQEISRERRALGVGGSGLGLTIVRLIAENTRCRVRFVKPDEGFSTAFELSWKET
jgi:signal transduction histidine kinase